MWLTAERRAQLSRSRSRQNVLSPEESQTVREINFDIELDTTPVLHRHDVRHKNHVQKVNGSTTVHNSKLQNGRPGKISTQSQAEELLERLRAL